tara:strand:+ start:327 stop:473 length:147 start_codon:yes stop_codon:yes gene_type:complete
LGYIQIQGEYKSYTFLPKVKHPQKKYIKDSPKMKTIPRVQVVSKKQNM